MISLKSVIKPGGSQEQLDTQVDQRQEQIHPSEQDQFPEPCWLKAEGSESLHACDTLLQPLSRHRRDRQPVPAKGAQLGGFGQDRFVELHGGRFQGLEHGHAAS